MNSSTTTKSRKNSRFVLTVPNLTRKDLESIYNLLLVGLREIADHAGNLKSYEKIETPLTALIAKTK